MATDLKLPFSAGAETSSVSFDPRRQIAPAGDEVTQVTQSGGKPALDVGTTIDAQFGDAEATTPGADAFADGPAGNTQQELNDRADAYVAKRKGVFSEYAQKSAKQKKLADQHTKALLAKMKDKKAVQDREAKAAKSKEAQAARRYNDQVGIAAQMKRRGMWQSIDQARAKSEVLHAVKIETAQKVDTKVTDTKVTDVKDTGVKDANVAVAQDPSKA